MAADIDLLLPIHEAVPAEGRRVPACASPEPQKVAIEATRAEPSSDPAIATLYGPVVDEDCDQCASRLYSDH